MANLKAFCILNQKEVLAQRRGDAERREENGSQKHFFLSAPLRLCASKLFFDSLRE
jgi:hypothetical protein